MFKKIGNTFTLNKTIKLSNQQLLKMSKLGGETAKRDYLLSIVGLKKSRLNVNTDKFNYQDELSVKGPNSVLRSFNTLLNNGAGVFHKPIVSNRHTSWIGVEIECLLPGDESEGECGVCSGAGEISCDNCSGDGYVLTEDGNGNEYRNECQDCNGNGYRECYECEGSGGASDGNGIFEKLREALRAERVTRVSVKTDGSLRGDDCTGVEVTLLFNSALGYEPLIKVCKILNDHGATINQSCGLHVHLDASRLNKAKVEKKGKIFSKFLPILSELVPASRRKNTYCALSVSKLNGERYHAVNLTAFNKCRTIEVRLHSGTTNATKIINWIELLKGIHKKGVVPSRTVTTLKALFTLVKLSEEQKKYFRKRHSEFATTSNDNEQEDVSENYEDFGLEAEGA